MPEKMESACNKVSLKILILITSSKGSDLSSAITRQASEVSPETFDRSGDWGLLMVMITMSSDCSQSSRESEKFEHL
jgi:hypothetical protein